LAKRRCSESYRVELAILEGIWMNPSTFQDAALVLIGHGSTLNRESGTPVLQHAATLRIRQVFAEVREGFWKQEPRVTEVLAAVRRPRVFLVPVFIGEGYFSEQVIPKALGFEREPGGELKRVREHRGERIYYCRPVGSHEGMTDVLLARAREVISRFPFPRAPRTSEISLFLAGHGTEVDENSRRVVEFQAEKLRGLGLYADVHAVFMEEEPRISSCVQLAQTRHVVVVPFFISDGLHVQEDIPVLLGEPERVVKQRLLNGQPTWRNPTEKHGKLVWYTPSIGAEPLLADVILQRVQEAVGWSWGPSEAGGTVSPGNRSA
jgi:sirohydrochlorin cobaltochelatase